MDALIDYFGLISVGFALVAFLTGLVRDPKADTHKRVTSAGAASTIPFGLVLIYAAVNPDALCRMSQLPRTPLALGGLAILCIYCQAATRKSD
jgi:hypothetical protein